MRPWWVVNALRLCEFCAWVILGQVCSIEVVGNLQFSYPTPGGTQNRVASHPAHALYCELWPRSSGSLETHMCCHLPAAWVVFIDCSQHFWNFVYRARKKHTSIIQQPFCHGVASACSVVETESTREFSVVEWTELPNENESENEFMNEKWKANMLWMWSRECPHCETSEQNHSGRTLLLSVESWTLLKSNLERPLGHWAMWFWTDRSTHFSLERR